MQKNITTYFKSTDIILHIICYSINNGLFKPVPSKQHGLTKYYPFYTSAKKGWQRNEIFLRKDINSVKGFSYEPKNQRFNYIIKRLRPTERSQERTENLFITDKIKEKINKSFLERFFNSSR
ncbi:MAG: hypothetical protein NG747_10140 [Candidatus Brocadia sp.]|nr:hypothetical protein [Candidatus Brocadia sp.]